MPADAGEDGEDPVIDAERAHLPRPASSST